MDTTLIDRITPHLVNAGHRVFQIHRFAQSEAEHCRRLLLWADLPIGARVIDMGCGIGAMAEQWTVHRSDLTFLLVNQSAMQLSYTSLPTYCGDFCHLPIDDMSADAVLFCFSIGHADHRMALREAARVLRPGGILFIYDMIVSVGTSAALPDLQYCIHNRTTIERLIDQSGFDLDIFLSPNPNHESYGQSILGESYETIFHNTEPAIWRAIRR